MGPSSHASRSTAPAAPTGSTGTVDASVREPLERPVPTETLPELPPADPAPQRDSSTLPLIFGTVAILCLAVVMSIAALVAADDGTDATASGGESVMVSEKE